MKTCKTCSTEKPLTDYYTVKSTNNSRYAMPDCKPCHTAKQRKWKKNNPKKHYQHTRSWKERGKGVYGIFSDNKCLYVGESGRLNGRINDHTHNINNPKSYNLHYELYVKLNKYDNIEFRILEECDNHKERESYWIQKFHPAYNSSVDV